jgi:predicted RNA-binding protein with TRAM domain
MKGYQDQKNRVALFNEMEMDVMERGGFGRGGGHSGGRGGFGGGGRREGGGGGFGRGGFGHGGFDNKPKPVKVGEEYDVEITDVGAKGDGITKVENFIVFVAGAKKGEKCRIRIKEVANKFAIGEKVGAGSSEGNESESKEESSEDESYMEAESTEEETH